MTLTARELGTRSSTGLLVIFISGALPALIMDFDSSAYSFASTFIIGNVNLPSYFLGILISGYAAGIALFSVIGGMLFDRFSPKVTVLTAILVFSVFTITTGYSVNASELLISRLLVGFGVGMFQAASVSVLGDTNPKFRGTGTMLWGVLAGVGTTTAPYLFLPFAGYRIPFLISGLLGFVVAGIFYAIVPKVFKHERMAGNPFRGAFNRYTVFPMLAIFLFGFTFLNLMGYYSQFLIHTAGFSRGAAGVIISMLGIGGIVFGLPAGYASDRIGRKPMLVMAIVFVAIAMTAITYAPSSFALYAGFTILFGTGWSIFSILTPASGQDMVPDDQVGSASGAILMAFNIGGIIGPLLLGYFITFVPFRSAMLYFMIIPAIVAVVLTAAMRYPKNIKDVLDEQLSAGLGE